VSCEVKEARRDDREMRLRCSWCGSQEAPFTKLKNGNFICKECYGELEKRQEEYEKIMKR
jgi:formylmethanofuran dehydrogenase subunit E